MEALVDANLKANHSDDKPDFKKFCLDLTEITLAEAATKVEPVKNDIGNIEYIKLGEESNE